MEPADNRRRLHGDARAGGMASDEMEPEEDEGGPDAASGDFGSQPSRPDYPPDSTQPLTTSPDVTASAGADSEPPTTSTPPPTTTAPPSTSTTSVPTPSPGLTPSPILSDEPSTGESSGALQSTASPDGGPGGGDGKTLTTVVIALGAVTAVLLVGLAVFCFVWRKRRRRRQGAKGKISAEFGNFITSTASSPSILESSTAQSTFKSVQTRSQSQRYWTGVSAASSSSARLQSALVDDVANVRIPFEKVVVGRLVNRGGYGEVYRGSYHGEVVAIKMLLPTSRHDIRQINAFLAEVKMMAAMEHDRVVRFIGVAWDSLSDLCAVSEYMEGGDLRTLLTQFEARERRPKGFDRDKARIALHVMHALTYLHSLDPVVLHRDLKSKNILLTADLDAKITDFGVSRESSDKTMTAGVGTSLWMAPEVMMGERYDEKADMFSFGVVLSELDSHLLPYAMAKETDSGRVLPDTAVLQMVSLGRLRIEMSPNAPQAVAELAYACVAMDPRARPSAPQALYRLDRVLKSYN